MALLNLIVEDGTGLANANTYATLAEADAYHSKRLYNTDWLATGDEKKKQALIMSTRMLDQEIAWYGEKTVPTSALRWPRSYVYDRDGTLIEPDIVPQIVKDGTAELALFMIQGDRTAERSGIGLKSLVVDVIELVYDKYDKSDIIPDSIRHMLGYLGNIATNVGIKTMKLART